MKWEEEMEGGRDSQVETPINVDRLREGNCLANVILGQINILHIFYINVQQTLSGGTSLS